MIKGVIIQVLTPRDNNRTYRIKYEGEDGEDITS